MRCEIVGHSVHLRSLSGQDIPDIEAPSPDPDKKVLRKDKSDIEAPSPDTSTKVTKKSLRQMLSRTFSKGGSANEEPSKRSSEVVVEDQTQTAMFEILCQKDPKEVSKNLKNLLLYVFI